MPKNKPPKQRFNKEDKKLLKDKKDGGKSFFDNFFKRFL